MTHCTQIVENRTTSPLPHPWSLQNNSQSNSRNWSNENLKNVNEHTCSLSLPPPNFWDCTRRGVEQSDRLVMLSLNRDTEMQEPAEGAHQMKKLKRTKHSCQSQMVCIYPSEPSCKTVERKMPRPLTTYLSMGGQIGRTVDQPAASPKWSLPANLLD